MVVVASSSLSSSSADGGGGGGGGVNVGEEQQAIDLKAWTIAEVDG